MEFNPSKCQVVRVTRSRSPLPTKYTLHGVTLEVVASAKYLGVDISNDLSWKSHVTRITKSLQTPSTQRKSILAHCQTPAGVCCSCLGPSYNGRHPKCLRVYRRIRAGDYLPYSSVSDMIGKFGSRTLEQRSADSHLVLFFKIIHGYVTVPLPSYVAQPPPPPPPPPSTAYPADITPWRSDSYTYGRTTTGTLSTR